MKFSLIRRLRTMPPVLSQLILLLFLLVSVCGNAGADKIGQAAQNAPAPSLHVEFFGAERGVAVGNEPITFLCVVRNVGTGPLPDKTLRLRCYTMAGLDYTSGDTTPILPALGPNQALAFRWRLTPTANSGPLIAAVFVENVAGAQNATGVPTGFGKGGPRAENGGNEGTAITVSPRVALTAVPRLAAPLTVGSYVPKAGSPPMASAEAGNARIGNDRIIACITAAEHGLPVLNVIAREGTTWRTVATGVSLVDVRSGEEGQKPWWETFHWQDSRTLVDKDSALLTLIGTVGTRWHAELSLEAHRNSAALSGHLRLSPLRTMRCFGVRLPRLLAAVENSAAPPKADGSPAVVAPVDVPLENASVAAWRTGGITFGLSWPAAPALPSEHWNRLPVGDATFDPLLGAECDTEQRGDVILPGATVIVPFRLFAFAPSDTVRDALRFLQP